MDQLDWRTEEDNWDEGPERPIPPRRSYRRVLLLLTPVVVGIALWLGWQLLTRQVETQLTDEVEAQVWAVHELVTTAAANRDTTLFADQLVTQPPDWQEAQVRLVRDGIWLNRPMIDLIATAAATTTLTLSPDLLTATMTRQQPYTDLVTEQTIVLQHHFVYERERLGERWLLTEIGSPAWGSWEKLELEQLTIFATAQDQTLVHRLATDLQTKLHTFCNALLGQNCPDTYHIELRFDTHPRALADFNHPDPAFLLNQRAMSLQQRATLNFPTPLLLGQPVDEAGYAALLRGYTTYLLYAVVAQQTGNFANKGDIYFQQVMLETMVMMGLRPQPAPQPATFATAARPTQDILLLCPQTPDIGATVYRVDSTSLSRQPLLTGRRLLNFQTTPGYPDLFLITEQADGLQASLWGPDGEHALLLDLPHTVPAAAIQLARPRHDPTRLYVNEFPLIMTAVFDLNQCQAEGCRVIERLSGHSQWSPDFRYRLTNQGQLAVEDSTGRFLTYLIGATNALWLDEDTLSYNRLVYDVIAPSEFSSSTIMLELLDLEFLIANVTKQGVVQQQGLDLRTIAPPDWEPNRWTTVWSTVHPEARHLVLLQLTEPFGADQTDPLQFRTLAYLYNQETGSREFLSYLDGMSSLQFAPQPRWITGVLANAVAHTQTLVLVDTTTYAQRPLLITRLATPYETSIHYQWSDDGEWLLVAYNGVVELFAAATGEHFPLTEPGDYCPVVTWADPSFGEWQ